MCSDWLFADHFFLKQSIGRLVGASQKEIIFTSGATESNNMAIKGIARFYKDKKRHIITTQTEHKCVLDSCRAMEAEGFEVLYLLCRMGSACMCVKLAAVNVGDVLTRADQWAHRFG